MVIALSVVLLLPTGCPDGTGLGTEADLTLFLFQDRENDDLHHDYVGAIAGTDIAVTLPALTPVTALKATAVCAPGATCSPDPAAATDYAAPVAITVTAEDGVSTQTYTVTVTVLDPEAPPQASITSFIFREADNPVLSADVVASIDGTAIAATVPYATDVFGLEPSINISGTLVSPASGVAQDFRYPVAYTVVGEGDALGQYLVAVTVAEPPGSVQVLRTGQTTSYAEGDDGDLQCGKVWPEARFTDNGDGTITDNLTGLMWEQNASLTERAWEDALDYANDSEVAGYTDWRLPNFLEMESLVNHEVVMQGTWLNSAGFQNVQDNWYWTSTTYATTSTSAFTVNLSLATSSWPDKSSPQYMLAVRGSSAATRKTGQTTTYYTGDDGDLEMGVPWPDPRFTDNGDNTVTDNLTGLVWEKEPPGSPMFWADALDYADGLNLGGKTDWRIPNKRELLSLYNLENGPQAAWLTAQGLAVVSGTHLSSTTNKDNGAQFVAVTLQLPYYCTELKTSTLYVCAVRGGG